MLQCLIKFFSVHSERGGKLVVLVGKVHNHLLDSCCRHLHLLAVGIEDSAKSKDLRNGKTRLRAYTSHTLCKLHKIRLRSRTVLRQHIHRRTDGKHRIFGAEQFLDTEDVSEFRYCLRGTCSQVHESHVDDVRGFHITLYRFESVLAETPGFLGEFVQLLTRSSGIHLLKRLIQFKDLLLRQPRVFSGVGEFLLHFSKSIHRLAARHNKTCYGSSKTHNERLRIVEPHVHSVPTGLLSCESSIDLLQFSFHRLNLGDVSVPSGGASLDTGQLRLQGFQCLVQFLRRSLVEPTEHLVSGSCRALQLSNHSVGVGEFTLQFTHRSLVAGGSRLSYLLLQVLSLTLKRGEHLLCLFAVNRKNDIGGSRIICHNLKFVALSSKFERKFWRHKRHWHSVKRVKKWCENLASFQFVKG